MAFHCARKMLVWRKQFSRMDLFRSSKILYSFRIITDKLFMSRKLTTAIILLLLVLLYLGPNWLYRHRPKPSAYSCLTDYAFRNLDDKERELLDNVFNGNSQYIKGMVQYIGNGYFGMSVDGRQPSLFLSHEDFVSVPVPVDLQISTVPSFAFTDELSATVLSIYKGVVTKVIAYNVLGECVVVSSSFYAHRTRRELLIQNVKIDNPTLSNIVISLKNVLMDDLLIPFLKEAGDFQIKSTKVTMQNSVDYSQLVIGRNKIPSQLTASPKSQESFTALTYLIYSGTLKTPSSADEFTTRATAVITKVQLDANQLLKHHLQGWNKLWQRGFSISHSKAPDTLNSEAVNTTLYYLLCNTVFSSVHGNATDVLDNKESVPLSSGQCFNFHNTLLYPSKLWPELRSARDVLDVYYRWKLTLDKRGCSSLVKSGAFGLLQAFLLSLGSFKFTRQHLEYDVDPRELHRDQRFVGLVYEPNVLLNVRVKVGDDNKPRMFVSANNTGGKKLFACDAACLDEAREIGSEEVDIPVKLTDPLTPILYVTGDQKHIQELRHSIHVKEIVEAPPHEHHVIAMHKHGHRLGGLPTVFWVALVFLLVSFHLFLFKLIYNEYCREGGSSSSQLPPSSRGPAYVPLISRTRFRV